MFFVLKRTKTSESYHRRKREGTESTTCWGSNETKKATLKEKGKTFVKPGSLVRKVCLVHCIMNDDQQTLDHETKQLNVVDIGTEKQVGREKHGQHQSSLNLELNALDCVVAGILGDNWKNENDESSQKALQV